MGIVRHIELRMWPSLEPPAAYVGTNALAGAISTRSLSSLSLNVHMPSNSKHALLPGRRLHSVSVATAPPSSHLPHPQPPVIMGTAVWRGCCDSSRPVMRASHQERLTVTSAQRLHSGSQTFTTCWCKPSHSRSSTSSCPCFAKAHISPVVQQSLCALSTSRSPAALPHGPGGSCVRCKASGCDHFQHLRSCSSPGSQTRW